MSVNSLENQNPLKNKIRVNGCKNNEKKLSLKIRMMKFINELKQDGVNRKDDGLEIIHSVAQSFGINIMEDILNQPKKDKWRFIKSFNKLAHQLFVGKTTIYRWRDKYKDYWRKVDGGIEIEENIWCRLSFKAEERFS